ncbi:MAG: superoxide dismutase [Burkholderiales bacterium]|nr:MAG: superoxide dismutase [Burkholderiales bacterium]
MLNRRSLMVGGAALAASAAAASCASAQMPAPASAGGALLAPKPLPFDPKTIPGLSEKLLVSHHDNNYAGAVKRLGDIEGQLRATDFATAPGFLINGLKREELMALNSVILHEAYFASLGKGGSKPGSALGKQLETDFGSHDKWRNEFVGIGKALGGSSGWVLLSWSPRMGRLVNQWSSDHTLTAADGQVLIALDMYEHAYHMDFGAKAAAYVDAFMGALDWANADKGFRPIQEL